MATVDPAGTASAALYTPPVPVQTATQTASVTERPVEQNNQPEPANDTVTQASQGGSNLGNNIDTTA